MEEVKETKIDRLKFLKKLYNQHKLSYKQYMLETKKVEKYWQDPVQTTEVEMPENPEIGGFVPADVDLSPVENLSDAEVELPVNPEL